LVAKLIPDNVIISDATVLINFLEVGEFRILLKVFEGRLHITNVVRGEIRRNRQVLDDAIAKGKIEEHEISLEQVRHLEKSYSSFNAGEASCFVLAKEKSWRIATDDGMAKQFIRRELGNPYVVTTFDVLLEAIDLGFIKRKDAEPLLTQMEGRADFQYEGQEEYKAFMQALRRR
jgi:predicted nucleic acid-binding protein